MIETLAPWIPLIIVVIAFLIGLAYKQARPTIDAFHVAFIWCFIIAVVWLIVYFLMAGGHLR